MNDNPGGPLLAGRVFDEPSHMFLDTGARIYLISLDFLRKAKPGLVISEPTTFNIRRVTGNNITYVGETRIFLFFFFFFTQKEAAQGHTHKKKKITKKPATRCSCQKTDTSVRKE